MVSWKKVGGKFTIIAFEGKPIGGKSKVVETTEVVEEVKPMTADEELDKMAAQ